MGVNRRGIVIEVIGDERGWLRSVERQVSANSTLDASYKRVGINARQTADAQVAAAVKASEALRANAVATAAAASRIPHGTSARAAADVAAADALAKYNRSIGVTTVSTRRFAQETKTAERDLGKVVRGGLAGAGIFSGLGRSLAFASGGFLAFSSGAALIRGSIDAARELAVTQRQVAAQLKTTGGTWGQYGDQINEADLRLSHLSGFTNQELLQSFGYLVRATGSVNQALKLNSLAADVARGRNISLSAAALALSKAVGGSVTALRRLGITVPKNVTGMQALEYVQRKFAGQAIAGASAADRFHATLVDTEEIIGTALLPIVNRYLSRLGDWLAKMNESGRLQRDVNRDLHEAGVVFHVLERAIGFVDDVTGSFANTLKIIFAFRLADLVTGWITKLDALTLSWAGVAEAATAARNAEAGAIALGGAGAGGTATRAVSGAEEAAGGAVAGAGFGALFGRLTGRTAAREADAAISEKALANMRAYTSSATEATAAIEGTGAAAVTASTEVAALSSSLGVLGAVAVAPIVIPIVFQQENRLGDLLSSHGNSRAGSIARDILLPTSLKDFTGVSLFNDIFRFRSHAQKVADAIFDEMQSRIAQNLRDPRHVSVVPREFQTPGLFGQIRQPAPRAFDAGVQRQRIFTQKFDLTANEQLAQAQAALTRSQQDDVRAARRIVARIRRAIDEGKYKGAALRQALQAEASALSTIWSAEDQAAQKHKQQVEAALQNMIDPLRLEARLSRAQALGLSTVPILRELRGSAQRALRSGKLTLEQQKEAWDQIASLNGQIKDALTSAQQTFTVPPALQLALAREEAVGGDTRKTLLKIRAAILRFIRSTHNVQALIDAYGQLASINEQLGRSAQTFTVPPQLQLNLARDQALGKDTTKDLLKIRASILKFIRTHKHNISALIDAYNQLSDINQQLGSTAAGALNLFKQASTKALTQGLGLTDDQRRRLRARLSQLGPGGTVPGEGVGAGGFAIDPETGRPLTRGEQARRRRSRGSGSTTGATATATSSGTEIIKVEVKLDGDVLARSLTRHQQRRRRRNPTQRRGPNASTATA